MYIYIYVFTNEKEISKRLRVTLKNKLGEKKKLLITRTNSTTTRARSLAFPSVPSSKLLRAF